VAEVCDREGGVVERVPGVAERRGAVYRGAALPFEVERERGCVVLVGGTAQVDGARVPVEEVLGDVVGEDDPTRGQSSPPRRALPEGVRVTSDTPVSPVPRTTMFGRAESVAVGERDELLRRAELPPLSGRDDGGGEDGREDGGGDEGREEGGGEDGREEGGDEGREVLGPEDPREVEGGDEGRLELLPSLESGRRVT